MVGLLMKYAIREYKKNRNVKQAASVFVIMTAFHATVIVVDGYLKLNGVK